MGLIHFILLMSRYSNSFRLIISGNPVFNNQVVFLKIPDHFFSGGQLMFLSMVNIQINKLFKIDYEVTRDICPMIMKLGLKAVY